MARAAAHAAATGCRVTAEGERRLRLWQDKIETRVDVLGSGPPVVFLHGPWGARHDGDFLERLATTHTVYVPWHPGTTPGDPDAIHQIDDWWDLIVYHGELFDRLELEAPDVVGHSFGGMVAAEIAATTPSRVGKLALLAPLGLWRDDAPVKNWMILPDDERRRALFEDPNGKAARRFFDLPDDREARAEALASFIWAQACTGKFVWPIPDKGLKKHIHRIAAPTLIIWGNQDGIVDAVYARDFVDRIARTRLAMIDGAGHFPQLEEAEVVAAIVRQFLQL